MANFFARRGAAYVNEMNRSLGALVGIAQGVLSDDQLSDQEIAFLDDWLTANDAIASQWPGDIIHCRIRSYLEDGTISKQERKHLMETLQQLIGGRLNELAEVAHVSQLALDQVARVEIPARMFCLTGDFVFAPRAVCEKAIEERGGMISRAISRKLDYLVVGGLGSPEWKYGSFGTKIEKAIDYRRRGLPILIVHEDSWAMSLNPIG